MLGRILEGSTYVFANPNYRKKEDPWNAIIGKWTVQQKKTLLTITGGFFTGMFPSILNLHLPFLRRTVPRAAYFEAMSRGTDRLCQADLLPYEEAPKLCETMRLDAQYCLQSSKVWELDSLG